MNPFDTDTPEFADPAFAGLSVLNVLPFVSFNIFSPPDPVFKKISPFAIAMFPCDVPGLTGDHLFVPVAGSTALSCPLLPIMNSVPPVP